jgi:hypothetical protein
MKPAYILLGVAAAAFTAFGAISADSHSAKISLRFVSADKVYENIKEELGAAAAAAVVSVDIRSNVLRIDETHPDAAKIRELVTRLDQRRSQVMVAATIKRVIPATPMSEGREEILSRPTIVGSSDQPMVLSFDDAKRGRIKIELRVTPLGPADK